MDQVKIGRFIAKERKQKKYTQRQLAEILGISDKTISKWECGNGFPEVSLLLPLCEELNINVNELLSGERLTEMDYKKKAEENMVDFIHEKEENKKKIWLSTLTGIIATVSFITLILVVVMYTDVMSLPVKMVLAAIACSIFAVGVYVAMQGERTIGYFKCQNCGKTFVPSFYAYSMGVHVFARRRLKCPCCGAKSWCKKVLSRE
ncbi:MAG: helix-turn-helix domain-containing protein [Lachnospiraceae bacterium]|nr:helix-turn-helix domain-containing protein [Lachnospiraceae bacterium]MDE6185948.1 helix-turn-helix domain-containing protein [Lachnospiraceae bacterium]